MLLCLLLRRSEWIFFIVLFGALRIGLALLARQLKKVGEERRCWELRKEIFSIPS